MQYKTIVDLLKTEPTHHEVTIRGWVRSYRSNRFIALSDGSTIKTLQCVVDFEIEVFLGFTSFFEKKGFNK